MIVAKGRRKTSKLKSQWGVVDNGVYVEFHRAHEQVNYRLAGYERLRKERNDLEIQLKTAMNMYNALVDRIKTEGVIL